MSEEIKMISGVNENLFLDTPDAKKKLENLIKSHNRIVVVFLSRSCPHCVHAYPSVVEIQRKVQPLVSYIVSRENNPGGITSVPTVHYYEKGILQKNFEPYMNEETILEFLQGNDKKQFEYQEIKKSRKTY